MPDDSPIQSNCIQYGVDGVHLRRPVRGVRPCICCFLWCTNVDIVQRDELRDMMAFEQLDDMLCANKLFTVVDPRVVRSPGRSRPFRGHELSATSRMAAKSSMIGGGRVHGGTRGMGCATLLRLG